MAGYTLGTYRISAAHLFPGSSLEELEKYHFWYLELTQRTAQYSYKAYIGEIREELASTTSTIEVSSDQLAHAEFLGSSRVTSYYVAPASVLSPYLRTQFSAAGLTYFYTAGPREDGFQPVRVVATTERLSNPYTRSAIIDFTDEELRQAVLLTSELRRLSTDDLRTIVEAYASAKEINHQFYSDPTACKFAATFEKAPDATLSELQQLSAKERASIEEDNSPFVCRDLSTRTQIAEETPLRSSIARGRLTLEQLENLQRELDEPLFCLLRDRKPLEAFEVCEEEEEIDVFVPQEMVTRVCNAARKDDPFSPLTWRRKMALCSALWEIDRKRSKTHLSKTRRQELEEQSWALRWALVNEQSSNYDRVHIMPTGSSTRIKGCFVQLYRRAA